MAEASGSKLGGPARYAPLVPTFSPYTADATAALRLAWRVIALASFTLVLLAVGVPLAYHAYVGSAIEPRSAEVTSIDGVVFLRKQGSREWSVAGPDATIGPGDTLRTAGNARAFFQLFDQSTVLLYPSSTMRILRAEQGRFRRERATVVLDLQSGRARLGVAPHDAGSAFFQVRSPHAEVHLEEGSYTLDATRDATHVRVRRGEAMAHLLPGVISTLHAVGVPGPNSLDIPRAVGANAGQRLLVRNDRAPAGYLSQRADLLENGYFTDRRGSELVGWALADVSEQEPAGTVSASDTPGTITFRRTGRGHGETLIAQQLDADLWDYEKLVLSADIRVLSHSLSGGGWQGTEYPLMLRVIYRDATGGRQPWYRGFYLHNDEGFPVTNGERLQSTDWRRTEIDLFAFVPRPWRIERVEIVASGWDYVSAVREIHLWAE